MFYIIQSNDTDTLVSHLIDFYKHLSSGTTLGQAVFAPFTVIVPSMVLGDWLTKQVALKLGVSTLFVAQFWGKYQWQMTQTVLEIDAKTHPNDALVVPEVAVLSASIMRWRIFGFVSSVIQKEQNNILENDSHPLHMLIKPLYDAQTHHVPEQRLWQACDELSSVYVRYLTHRPEWLLAWANNQSLQALVQKMMSDKARLEREFGVVKTDDEGDELPEWLRQHYLSLERLLHFLWHRLFAQTYLYREALESRFWQVLSGKRGKTLAKQATQALPSRLYLFTIQQIPQVELNFLKELSLYLDVVLFHFNPSKMFWADIVDKNWLLTQRIIKPDSVYLKDYGHALLSRLGKESRETFAMLADMSGGADEGAWAIQWQDDFVCHYDKNPTLLNALKQDILMLEQANTDVRQTLGGQMMALLQHDEALTQKVRPKVGLPLEQVGDSLSIHACHGLKRQLEIARLMIAKYLNEPSDTPRVLSDVVVLLPDVAVARELILAVFPEGQGVDGLTLPIKITGTTDKNIDELLYAILGFYELLGEPSSRFYADEVYEWLLTPALYESFGLVFDEMKRGCELLTKAGFRRGFDEAHLAHTLDSHDTDYRYTFSYALDRVVLGLIAPTDGRPNTTLHPFSWQEGAFVEAVLPLEGVSLADEKIINALTAIHEGLHDNRHAYHRIDDVEVLLEAIESQVIRRYFGVFHQSIAMRAIFNSKNAMKASLRANKSHYRHSAPHDKVLLSLKFVLNSLVNDVKAQALSAEPAQVITFARFGALRSIPFGLTIMLDMNISSFPRQDRAVRLDLMRAGVNRWGDRYNEDDDNGAFLDALLCTKDRVMIFYNGFSPDGQTELLPASVVGEMLQFFKTDALWHSQETDDGMVHALKTTLPKLIEDYLITQHEAYAFDRQVFYETPYHATYDDELQALLHQKLASLKRKQKQSLPPPPIWHLVRQALDSPKKNSSAVSLPTPETLKSIADALMNIALYDEPTFDEQALEAFERLWDVGADEQGVFYQGAIYELNFAITKPAKAFLSHKLKFLPSEVSETGDEPLALDTLQNYQLNELMIQMAKAGVFDGQTLSNFNEKLLAGHHQKTDAPVSSLDLQSLYYGDLLPAGVPRLTVTGENLHIFEEKMAQFAILASKIDDDLLKTALNARLMSPLDYSNQLTATSEQMVSFTLANRAMSLVGELPAQGTSLWLNLVPNTAKASHLVRFWLYHLLWQISDDTPNKTSIWQFYKESDEVGFAKKTMFILTPVVPNKAKIYLWQMMVVGKLAKQLPLVMTCREGINHAKDDPKKSMTLKKWLDYPKSTSFIDDSNYHHQDWQFILQADDPKQRLMDTFVITDILYAPLAYHLKALF